MFSDFYSAVNRDDVELFGADFESFNFIGDLDAEFSCGEDDEELNVLIFEEFLVSEFFNDWEGVGKGFSAACSVSSDEITSGVNGFIGHVLDGEEELDVFFV